MATKPPSSKEWDDWKAKEESNLRKGGKPSYFTDKSTGITWRLDRKNEAGKPLRFSPKASIDKAKENVINGAKRRATVQAKSFALEDYIDWAKRNLYIDPVAIATKIYEQMNGELDGVRTDKTPGTIYGHPSPISSPIKGGLEHPRNVLRQDLASNGKQLDRIPSTEAHQKAGIPLTKSGAIRADMRKQPVVPPQKRLAIIQNDLESNVRPTARAVKLKLTNSLAKLQIKNGGTRTTGMSPLEQLRILNSSATGIAKATNNQLLEDAGTFGRRLYVPIAD